MMFDEFSEMVERNCQNGWRSFIGRDNDDIIESVNSIIFTRKSESGRWIFSFGLRIGERWHQSKTEIEQVEYDILNPPPVTEEYNPNKCMSPENTASMMATQLLENICEEVSIWRPTSA